MTKQRILLLGATGQTGRSILQALLKDTESFVRNTLFALPTFSPGSLGQDVEALVRPSSVNKPEVKNLAELGVTTRVVDIGGPLDELVSALKGIDVFISAIDATGQLAQVQLVTAAKMAGVKRFVPCAFITVAPPGGVMALRDNVRLISFQTVVSESTYPVPERGSLPRDPQAVPSVHGHRRRLLASNLFPYSAFGSCGLCRSGKPERRYPRGWHRAHHAYRPARHRHLRRTHNQGPPHAQQVRFYV